MSDEIFEGSEEVGLARPKFFSDDARTWLFSAAPDWRL